MPSTPTGRGLAQRRRRSRDDATVLAALEPYVRGDCLVAFDAPLVVTNPTGQRPAEAALNRDFRRFEAGAHPANTAKPEFADTPRAARLARALGLDMDPRSSARAARHRGLPASGDRGAVPAGANPQVQGQTRPRPRPAQVGAAAADGRHREARARHGAAARRRPRRWVELRRQVVTAQRKSELRRAEDPVDAVVCAYVALYAQRCPAGRHDLRRLRHGVHRDSVAAPPLAVRSARAADRWVRARR